MKLFQIVSILVLIVSFLYFSPRAYAQVQTYDADVDLSPAGNAKIALTITFSQPVKGFQLTLLGTIKNFNATSNSGPVDCDLTVGAASIVDCKMNLTQDRRRLELNFESADFVKIINSKSIFSLDLSLSQDIKNAVATVKFPEGYALVNTSTIPATNPPATNIISDGRRIIVNWDYVNVTAGQSFKFQTLYEPLKNPFPTALLAIGVIAVTALGGGVFFYYRRIKQPKEVILSVLDDFEKKVVEVINNAGGEINQRKVVQETNLSKAKVSRVIKRLQERGLVEVTRLGRTNKLKLVKKKFEGI